jgi:hypothetical protein
MFPILSSVIAVIAVNSKTCIKSFCKIRTPEAPADISVRKGAFAFLKGL